MDQFALPPLALSAQFKLDVDGTARISGRLELASPGSSLFIGTSAGAVDDGTDNLNTFIGWSAGSSNTTGFYNTFLGWSAGGSNTTGWSNTFVGYEAGSSNTEGGGIHF